MKFLKEWWPLFSGILIGFAGGWGMGVLLTQGSKLWLIPAFIMVGYIAFWLIKAMLIISRMGGER